MLGSRLQRMVDAVMPEVVNELSALAAIPSAACPGNPREPVMQDADATLEVLRRYGVHTARLIEISGGFPAV